MFGINLSGAEFGGTAGTYGKNYIYPSLKDLTYYHNQGVELVRLPFRWERMQPKLGGPLDQAELGRMKDFLASAEKLGMEVIIDLHNYGRYGSQTIGSAGVSTAQFADFWSKLAGALKGSPALAGYDIMNEPHDMGGADRWPKAAQAAVDAIRKVDMTHDIYVEGDGWSGAHSWQKINGNLNIKDPADKLIYEAHQYFDKNNSGTYQNSYAADGVTPMTGVERLQPFIDWLKATGNKGFIGEFAVPDNDPKWLPVLDNFMDAMAANGISGTYWGAGPWWGNYPLALVGSDGKPNPQLAILVDHVNDGGAVPSIPTPSKPETPDTPDDTPPSGVNVANGGAGNDTINGTKGADLIHGHGGNDTIIGGAGDDLLYGDAGNDKLQSGGGLNKLYGGLGDDVYLLDQSTDIVVEKSGEGKDRIETAFSYTLPANVEDLVLRTGASINGTGNDLDNRLTGNSGVNQLSGGNGNDVLIGAGGADVLTGGAGKDVFLYQDAAHSRGNAIDKILDFKVGQDRIDLSKIDADAGAGGNQAFKFIGRGAFTGDAGELHAVVRGNDTYVEADLNGDKTADFAIHLTGMTTPLTNAEFVL